MTSTEIAIRDTGNGVIAERDIIDGWIVMASDVFKLAAHICDTEFVPDAYRGNAPAVAAAILTGRELGIGPMTSLRHVQVVKGSPSLSAEYKRARVLAAGHDLDIIELNTSRCRVIGRRRGKPPLEITFTMDDAKTAGLLAPSRSGKPGSWQTRPRRMLFARASTEVCDFMFTDITNGLPTTELLLEGGDDPFGGYDESPSQPPPVTAAEPAKSRTAQRKPRTTPDASPAPAAPTAAPAQPPSQGAGEALPPLPGEGDAPAVPDETAPSGPAAGADPTTSGASSSAGAPASGSRTATGARSQSSPDGSASSPDDRHRRLVGIVHAHFKRLYPDGIDDAERLIATAKLANVGADLQSSNELDEDELSTVADTLARCKNAGALEALLDAAGKAARDGE